MADEPPKKKVKKKKRVHWDELPPNEEGTFTVDKDVASEGECTIPVHSGMNEELETDLVIDTDKEDNLQSLDDQIEYQLEEKAKKNNLTVTNVKNILKAVITNKDVVEMVNNSLKGEKFENYRPKFTRSKTKELFETFDLEQMASKKSSYVSILEQELSEDSSSDEEYTPNEDSDVENKTADSIPESPMPDSPYFSSICGDESGAEIDENIGQRTRSKLSLSETPLEAIEQLFVPPDVTTDMYDTECDNQDWLDFLKDIQNPLDRTVEQVEDDNDPEYNVMVEESIEHIDFEELRHDRAVKVTKTELHALMNEWFGCEDFSSEDEIETLQKKKVKNSPTKNKDRSPSTSAESPSTSPATPSHKEHQIPLDELTEILTLYKRENFFNNEQYLLLRQQMQQHIQLLLQSYLLTYKHPYVETQVPHKCKEMILAINCLADSNEKSTFKVLNLKSSVNLLQNWDIYMSTNANSLPVVQFMEKEFTNGDTRQKKRSIIPAKIPPQLIKFCADSTAFLYPLLLPTLGVMFTANKTGRVEYMPHENHLIALGLEQITDALVSSNNTTPKLIDICKNISICLMPHREPRSIMAHIKWLLKESGPNPIKHYYEFKQAPTVKHFVINMDNCLKLSEHSQQLIPPNWKKHIFRKPKFFYYQMPVKRVHKL